MNPSQKRGVLELVVGDTVAVAAVLLTLQTQQHWIPIVGVLFLLGTVWRGSRLTLTGNNTTVEENRTPN